MYMVIFDLCINIYILCWWSPFIPSRNLKYVFTYMSIMSIRRSSRIKDFNDFNESRSFIIHNYIRSFLNIILILILIVRTRLETISYCLCVERLYIYIYIYIYIYTTIHFMFIVKCI